MTQQVSTRAFSYCKQRRRMLAEASTLRLVPGRAFPLTLDVVSEYTGRTVRWFFDQEAAERAEWWDGEEAHYYTRTPGCNADTLVIIND